MGLKTASKRNRHQPVPLFIFPFAHTLDGCCRHQTQTCFYPKLIIAFTLNWPLEPMQALCLVGHLVCLLQGMVNYVKRIKQAKMPTTRRKMYRKQRKQPKIIGKRYNHQLGSKRVAGRRTALPIWHTTPFILKTAGQHGH